MKKLGLITNWGVFNWKKKTREGTKMWKKKKKNKEKKTKEWKIQIHYVNFPHNVFEFFIHLFFSIGFSI